MKHNIFHLRLQNLELQAERLMDSSLRTRPLAVISSHHANGTVVALSEEAEAEGLFRGMKVSLARNMSHGVRLLPYNRTLYSSVHSRIYQTVQRYTPLSEPTCFGQYYLDMTGTGGMYGAMQDMGRRIAADIHSGLNLQSRVGISANKLVSRISTGVIPEMVWQVKNGDEETFVAPLSPALLPVCRETQLRKLLKFLMLSCIVQIQDILRNTQLAAVLFGAFQKSLDMQAFGRDLSLVRPPLMKEQFSEQEVLSKDSNDRPLLHAVVRKLAAKVGFRLRECSKSAKQVLLEVHYTDGFLHKRRGRLKGNGNEEIIETCIELFEKASARRNRVRAVIISAADLFMVDRQLSLFNDHHVKENKISIALDKIRSTYGINSIYRGMA